MLKKVFSSFLLGLVLVSCQKSEQVNDSKSKKLSVIRDLPEIKKGGKLTALVDYSSTSYFIYKGIPMGFEYELLSRFADELNIKLVIKPVKELASILDSLVEHKGDLIAANLTKTKERSKIVHFSKPIIRTKQVLVQRLPTSQNSEKTIQYLDELIGKEIHVQRASSFYNRLINLSDEIGGDIVIKEVAQDLTVEELIAAVSKGEIQYTIADEHVAKINKAFFRNIHIRNAISLEQQVAWAVRKDSPELLTILDEWLSRFRKTADYRVIYLKYYGNTSLYKSRINSDLFTAKSGQISTYDSLVQLHSKSINWDWRLLTSLIYQESQFNHYASSWAGAKGLMQLMPNTAAQYGLDSTATPEENLKAGVAYISWLDQQFAPKVKNKAERIKFVLAAYNVGLGHVFDAIRLAQKYGLNPYVWQSNVAEMLLKKSNPKYYKDDVVHYGYCRGREPYRYVEDIFTRFSHYLNLTEQ